MPVNAHALSRLTDVFAGEVVLRGDPEYDSARVVWNGMVDRYPALVVRPTEADDVIAAVRLHARYVNDVVEVGEDVVRSIYGDAKYERLVALKRAWDPDNVFRLNQNVRP